jgi:hypothetical protein
MLVLLVNYVLRGRRRQLLRRCALALLASLLMSSTATAQPATLDTAYPVEQFRRAGEGQGILDIGWGGVPAYQTLDVGLWLGYADDPLDVHYRMNGNGERVGSLVGRRISGALVSSLSPRPWLQLGLAMQVALSQEQDAGAQTSGTSLATAGVGLLHLTPRAQLLRQARHGVDLAVTAGFTAPAGASDIYMVDSGVALVPEVMLARAFTARLRGAVSVGYRLRERHRVQDRVVDDELHAHAGIGYQITGALALDATLAVVTPAAALFHAGNQEGYGQAQGGMSYTRGRWTAFAATGACWQEGAGAPGWHALGGVRLTPAPAAPAR